MNGMPTYIDCTIYLMFVFYSKNVNNSGYIIVSSKDVEFSKAQGGKSACNLAKQMTCVFLEYQGTFTCKII